MSERGQWPIYPSCQSGLSETDYEVGECTQCGFDLDGEDAEDGDFSEWHGTASGARYKTVLTLKEGTVKNINFPIEKKCGRCRQVKPWTDFYVVPSYADNLSRICKLCNSEDGQIRQHRRQLEKQGRTKFAERIVRLRALADLMEAILNE